jgi:hypothetical protein
VNYHTSGHLPEVISAIRVEGNFLRFGQETGAANEPIRYNKYGKNGEVNMDRTYKNEQ